MPPHIRSRPTICRLDLQRAIVIVLRLQRIDAPVRRAEPGKQRCIFRIALESFVQAPRDASALEPSPPAISARKATTSGTLRSFSGRASSTRNASSRAAGAVVQLGQLKSAREVAAVARLIERTAISASAPSCHRRRVVAARDHIVRPDPSGPITRALSTLASADILSPARSIQ